MPRYLITMTEANAARLEALLGGRIAIVPSYGPLADAEARGEVTISGLDAVFPGEMDDVEQRLRTSGPRYHHGGPGMRPAAVKVRPVHRHAAMAEADDPALD